MPATTCEKCGGVTNSAVSDYDFVVKKATGCYARVENGIWVEGCSFKSCGIYTMPSVKKLLGKSVEKCPHREWLFDDALHGSSGAHRCMASGRQWQDANMKTADFPECEEDDPNCPKRHGG